MLPRALPGGAAGWSCTWGRRVAVGRRQSSVWALLGRGPSIRADQPPPPPQVSRGVDINTDAQPGPRGREGGEGMFSHLHSPTPHRGGGGGQQGRGGDSRASNSCISHDTAAVRASWEQCPARGNRSSTRGRVAVAWGEKVFATLAWPAERGNCCSANSSETVPW